MPEAVMTAARRFAPPARGAVSSSQEALVPQEPMQTPHPTSQSSHAPSALAAARPAPEQAGARRRPRPPRPAGCRRPGRRVLHAVRVHHRGPRLGTRGRHVAVGRLRLRQARLGLQGHPQALLHRHRVLERRRLRHPREPAQRPERRQAQLPATTTPSRAPAPRRRSRPAPPRRPPGRASATASSPARCARPSTPRRRSRPRPARSASSPRPTWATTAPTAAPSGWCTPAAGS